MAQHHANLSVVAKKMSKQMSNSAGCDVSALKLSVSLSDEASFVFVFLSSARVTQTLTCVETGRVGERRKAAASVMYVVSWYIGPERTRGGFVFP